MGADQEEMMGLPKRRRNRLKAYDYRAPGAYFVTVCVKEHRNLLGEVTAGADAYIGPYGFFRFFRKKKP